MSGDDEAFFHSIVMACTHIGYGRMMQIISHEWYRHDQYGALIPGTAVGLLSLDEQAAFAAEVAHDRLFRKDEPKA